MLAIKSLATVVAAGAGLAVASSSMMPVQAFSLTNDPACSSGDVSGSSQCSGSYSLDNGENDVTDGGDDNIATQLLNVYDVFDVSGGWNFHQKNEYGGDETSGTFAFDDVDFDNVDFANNDLAISLKAAQGFSLYYIEAGELSSGDAISWNTKGTSTNGGGKAQALSHASVFVRDASKDQNNDDASQDIPEPATGMALGIVGLGAFAYKRKSQDASQ
jgi:hypothetical protein